jgi:hypothetical protein
MHEGQARLPNSAHTSRPWRIHEITPDFRLEDVWALPVRGEESDFPALVQGFAAGDPSQGFSWLARALWSTRWKVGELLGWDEAKTGLGAMVPTLRERLPGDLLDAPGPGFDALPFISLYLIENEFAAEIANRTMHGACTSAGLLTGRVVTVARWPSWSSQMGSSGPCIWPRSDPSGTWSSTPRRCDRSSATGRDQIEPVFRVPAVRIESVSWS